MGTKLFKQIRILSLTVSVMLVMDSGLSALADLPPIQASPKIDRGSGVLVAGLRFSLPNIRSSRNHTAGASRGTSCSAQSQPARALLPSSQIGLTVTASPALFVNLPQASTKSAEFTLTEAQDGQLGEEVYRTMLELPEKPGVASLTLPKEKAASSLLKVGKRYQWELSLICDSSDRAKDVVIQGEIQRVELSLTLANQLEKAAPQDRPTIFANAGLWYDTVASLAQLRETNPTDPKLAEDWKTLLQSVGLDTAIAQSPLVGSLATVKN